VTKLLELVLTGTDNFQETINRFNYTVTSSVETEVNGAALIQAFGAIWDGTEYPSGLPLRDFMQMLNDEYCFLSVSARDVYSDVDFAEVPLVHDACGAVTVGDIEPPFVAFGFRTNRIRRDIRRGTKRFSGVSETDSDGGGLLNGAAVTRVEIAAAAMSAVLTQTVAGVDYTFHPVIVGKMRYLPPDNTVFNAAGTAYTYWPDFATQADHLASDPTWEIYPTFRSQVSRQYGKGR
jgi:hypothetical protein